MKALDLLRLAGFSLALLLVEQAIQLARPEWRSGSDVFLIWLVILSASRGPLIGAAFALAGGLFMDASSGHFAVFHLLYYFVPVALGTLFRSQLIVEYGLLGSVVAAGLLLGKILAMLLVGIMGGMLSGPGYLWDLNYWPLLVSSLVVFVAWRWLVGLARPLKAVSFGR